MSKTYLQPGGDYVLVVDKPREQTIDGIAMPDNIRQQDMVFGYVVATGARCLEAKEQDTVCYGPYAGKSVNLDGVSFRIMREGQIEAYVRTVKEPKEPTPESILKSWRRKYFRLGRIK